LRIFSGVSPAVSKFKINVYRDAGSCDTSLTVADVGINGNSI